MKRRRKKMMMMMMKNGVDGLPIWRIAEKIRWCIQKFPD
jgi:hypothetical protein